MCHTKEPNFSKLMSFKRLSTCRIIFTNYRDLSAVHTTSQKKPKSCFGGFSDSARTGKSTRSTCKTLLGETPTIVTKILILCLQPELLGAFCFLVFFSTFETIDKTWSFMKRIPHTTKVFGQTGLSKQCRPRSGCSSTQIRLLLYADLKQSDQSLYCLPFRLHLLDELLYVKTTLFKF